MSLAWSSVKALSIPVGGTARDVKAVSIGGVTVWRKLPYDAEVEYIESTRTQYIDTGINGGDGIDFDYAVRFTELNTTVASGIVGCYQLNRQCYGGLVRTNGKLGYSFYNIIQEAMSSSANVDYAVQCHLFSGNQTMTVNGSLKKTTSVAGTFDSERTMYIFAIHNNNDEASLPSKMRLYHLKIMKNGVTVRDFHPVRVGSGANAVGCLYDKLGTGGQNPDGSARNDGLYFRQGSGAFVVGPDRNA